MSSSPDPPLHVGRYLLFDEIASGGMAQVRYGRQLGAAGFSRTVAVKRLHPHLARDPEFTAMFLDEARMAGRIRHPNVVPTLDVVSLDSELLIVMEYVRGESLSRLTRTCRQRGQKVPLGVLASIMAGVLHGLHAAHEARDERGSPMQLVHRDVSPQNILVGADGSAHVLDFGIAKAVGRAQQTSDGRIKGKPAYMAPEQLCGGDVTRAADIYAAGVVLWEAATGQRLFAGDNEYLVIDQVLTSTAAAPSELDPSLPPALDQIVMRALDRDPAARFPTARAMAAAIERDLPLAGSTQVAEWVEQVAGTTVAERDACVLAIENHPASATGAQPAGDTTRTPSSPEPLPDTANLLAVTSGPAITSTTVPTVTSVVRVTERTYRQRLLGLGLGVAAVVFFVGVFAARSSRSSASVAAPASAPVPALSVPALPVPGTASAPSASTGPVASVAGRGPAERAASSARPGARPAAGARTAAPRPDDCAIPFTVGADGRHHLKPQCVQ